MPDVDFIGAYRTQGVNHEKWVLTDKAADIASLPDEEVVFCTDIESLQSALDERYGVTKTGLRRTTGRWGSVQVYPYPFYDGRSLDELQRHLADNDSITVHGFWSPDDLRSTDIIVADGVARLDPKKAKARRRSAQTRQAKKPVGINAIRDLGYAALSGLRAALGLHSFQTSFGSNDTARLLTQVLSCVSVFNATFGTNAHRKLPAFLSLQMAWNEKPEVNERAYGTTLFGAWMKTEAQAEAATVAKDHKWAVTSVAEGLTPATPDQSAD
jgi:hypothetical protein